VDAGHGTEVRPDVAYAAGQWLATRVAAGAGVLVLCGVPALTCAQEQPSAPPPVIRHAGPAEGPARKAQSAEDVFAGLTYTAQQKTNIQLIQKNSKMRRDSVLKDEKLSPEQRDAMLQGLERIERGQIFRALTPEQQAEVRKRILDQREAEARQRREQEQQAKQRSPALPPSR
jgi:Spy/CpxP family protein refolding chaperone